MPAPSPKLRSVRVVPEEGPPPADLPDGIILPRRPSASVIDLSKQWRRGLWRQATAPAGNYFIGLLRRLIPKFHPGLERGYASYKLQGVRGVQQGICLVLALFLACYAPAAVPVPLYRGPLLPTSKQTARCRRAKFQLERPASPARASSFLQRLKLGLLVS